MAGFGGSVKLTGESEYRKALTQITQNLKVVSAQMKATSSGFDSGEKSMKDLENESKTLSKSLESQKSALSTLKSQLSTMSAEYSKTEASHKKLVSQYETEKAKLEQIKSTLGTSSNEYKNQEKVVNELGQEVTKSAKSYDAQGKALNDMKIKTANAETTCNQTAKALDSLGKEAEEAGSQAKKGGDGFTVFKGVVANLASSAITSAVSGLKNLGGACLNMGKQALDGYAQVEQLRGGVQKIFGDDLAKEVEANANNAFKTAGMSANEYMDTVTGFSATLLQGLGKDTSKSAQYADTAIRNMSDNANTFGTDISMIQNAYQGFAKGNFTMLDNLKLGYGGTQAEMARLVNESGVLGDSMEVTAESVKDVPFHKMIEAIDKTQERMGIMGTTTKEASGTIEGSTGSMKSAWENLLTGMADENADFGTLVENFIGTLITEDGKGGVIGTIVPRISQVITGLANTMADMLPKLIQQIVPIIQENLPIIIDALSQALTTIADVLPQILPVIAELIPQIVNTLIGLLPQIIQAGISLILGLIQGITDAIPQLTAMLPNVITSIVTTLIDALPQILDAGIELLLALVDGIMKAIPKLVKKMPKIINSMIDKLISMIPKIINAGIKLLVSLVDNMPKIINGIVKALPQLITGLITGLTNNLPKIIDAGVKLFMALVENMPKIISEVVKAIPKIIKAIVKGLKDSAPKMAKAGLDLIKGLWKGINDATSWIKDKLMGFCKKVLKGLKDFFKIKSPSRVMRDEVGKYLAQGVGVGFTDEMQNVTSDMQNSVPTNFDIDANVRANANGYNGYNAPISYNNMVGAFKEALSQMTVELDDDKVGKFVTKTVANAIYA